MMKKWFLALLVSFPLAAAEPWPEVKWEVLVPKHWNPAKKFKHLDFSKLQDSDPRAMELLDEIKQEWDNAPIEHSLNGKKMRIAGFTLPLERKGDKVTEFILVPYFGACIHTPPPPANQIIHAKSKIPLSGIQIMMPIWVFGTLSVQRGDTTWGVAGYGLSVDKVVPYKEKKQ
ncbi:MAG: DUF3299 domain-containing protein [Rhodocyclaceae bacterium]|nr:DUF3299 domain-containing protein [Rhodocyclaceae bacterium]